MSAGTLRVTTIKGPGAWYCQTFFYFSDNIASSENQLIRRSSFEVSGCHTSLLTVGLTFTFMITRNSEAHFEKSVMHLGQLISEVIIMHGWEHWSMNQFKGQSMRREIFKLYLKTCHVNKWIISGHNVDVCIIISVPMTCRQHWRLMPTLYTISFKLVFHYA